MIKIGQEEMEVEIKTGLKEMKATSSEGDRGRSGLL
jgi:hypothetical protein